MVELIACTGLRPREVIALQAGDVDLDARRIKVTNTTTIDLNVESMISEPKHGERHEVPIAPHLVNPSPLSSVDGLAVPRSSPRSTAR